MAAIYQCGVYVCVLCVSVSMSVCVCLYACIVIWMIGAAAVLKSRCVCVYVGMWVCEWVGVCNVDFTGPRND